MSINPVEIPTGAVRYNTDSNKMEVYIGSTWMEVAVSTPNLGNSAAGARGLIMGGNSPGAPNDGRLNNIEFVTISSAGNSQDFGDLTGNGRSSTGSCASRVRGLCMGGFDENTPNYNNEIDFVTFSSTGNAQDFGDIGSKFTSYAQNGYGNATRGVFPLCDSNDSGNYKCDTLDFITLSTLGNTTEYGDLTTSRAIACSFSNPTRGILVGGGSPASDDIDYNNIASGGTSVDFGEYSAYSQLTAASGCSNAHGGL